MRVWTYVDPEDLAAIAIDSALATRVQVQINEQKSRTRTRYRMVAQSRAIEGTLEVDDDAPVSMCGGAGAYVQAWVWVEETERRANHFVNRW